MATVNKPQPKAESIIGAGAFKILVIASLLLALIGAFQAKGGSRATGPGCGDCVQVSADFTKLQLPDQAGCWEIQLDPNRFSGRVYLPLRMNFAMDWSSDEPAQIKDRFGNIVDIDPRTDQDLDNNVRNSILRFRGHGSVRIYIQPQAH